MENASKALIIAGAILLSILLISLGIMIFNQAQDTVNNSGMSQAEIATFNNQFLKYEGAQKGSVVKSMINEVIASNSDDNHKDAQVAITHNGNAATITTSKINTSRTYDIEITYKDGRVNVINIQGTFDT